MDARPVNGPLYQPCAPGAAAPSGIQVQAPENTDPWTLCFWQQGVCATHPPCVVEHYKGATCLDVVSVNVQEVLIGILRTKVVAILTIDDVDKRYNGGLISKRAGRNCSIRLEAL